MNTALIMAGGSGTRMQANDKKQFIMINGKPLLQHTLEQFIYHPAIDEIVLVVPEEDLRRSEDLCSVMDAPHIRIVTGGPVRQQSVINGLKCCPPETDTVLIHDGVRPFVSGELITKMLSMVKKYKAVIPVSKVRNTIKEVENDHVVRTVPRWDLYNALTPQVFAYELILSCHLKAKVVNHRFTDDSSILEYFSYPVHILVTDDSNFKITEPNDLKIARLLLQHSNEDIFE